MKQYREAWVRCGKDGCKKCADGRGHGPYFYTFWVEHGKTRQQYVGKQLPPDVDPADVKRLGQ